MRLHDLEQDPDPEFESDTFMRTPEGKYVVEFVVEGVKTTVPLALEILDHPAFAEATWYPVIAACGAVPRWYSSPLWIGPCSIWMRVLDVCGLIATGRIPRRKMLYFTRPVRLPE